MQLHSEIFALANLLKDLTPDWDIRNNALLQFQAKLQAVSKITDPSSFRPLINSLNIQLVERRSILLATICNTISLISRKLGDDFEEYAEMLIPNLYKLLIQGRVNSSIPLIRDGIVHQHHAIRARAATYLHTLLKKATRPEEIEEQREVIAEGIRKSLVDSTPAGREAGRLSFVEFQRLWPKESKALLASLDPSLQKKLSVFTKTSVGSLRKEENKEEKELKEVKAKREIKEERDKKDKREAGVVKESQKKMLSSGVRIPKASVTTTTVLRKQNSAPSLGVRTIEFLDSQQTVLQFMPAAPVSADSSPPDTRPSPPAVSSSDQFSMFARSCDSNVNLTIASDSALILAAGASTVASSCEQTATAATGNTELQFYAPESLRVIDPSAITSTLANATAVDNANTTDDVPSFVSITSLETTQTTACSLGDVSTPATSDSAGKCIAPVEAAATSDAPAAGPSTEETKFATSVLVTPADSAAESIIPTAAPPVGIPSEMYIPITVPISSIATAKVATPAMESPINVHPFFLSDISFATTTSTSDSAPIPPHDALDCGEVDFSACATAPEASAEVEVEAPLPSLASLMSFPSPSNAPSPEVSTITTLPTSQLASLPSDDKGCPSSPSPSLPSLSNLSICIEEIDEEISFRFVHPKGTGATTRHSSSGEVSLETLPAILSSTVAPAHPPISVASEEVIRSISAHPAPVTSSPAPATITRATELPATPSAQPVRQTDAATPLATPSRPLFSIFVSIPATPKNNDAEDTKRSSSTPAPLAPPAVCPKVESKRISVSTKSTAVGASSTLFSTVTGRDKENLHNKAASFSVAKDKPRTPAFHTKDRPTPSASVITSRSRSTSTPSVPSHATRSTKPGTILPPKAGAKQVI